MSARSAADAPSLPVAWPLAGSVVLTTMVVAFVCTPPGRDVHSWAAIFSRATVYLLAAGVVHALAVWGVCRVRDESEDASGTVIWGVIWAAWIAVVWLPLVALLTWEHSPWVAMVLPLSAVFATLLLKWRAAQIAGQMAMPEDCLADFEVEPALFRPLEAAPVWRVLLPAVGTSVAAQVGGALLAGGHAWTAGCLFGAGAIYPVGRWMGRVGVAGGEAGGRRWGRTSAGNSVVVWLLLVMALVPFLAMYVAGTMSRLVGARAGGGTPAAVHRVAAGRSSGYSGIILVQPKKPHEMVVSDPAASAGSLRDTRVIPFDGAYWYFKQPDTRPARNARVMEGDPAKKRVFSTDTQPLMMEAHQPLGRAVAMSCCRSLRVDVTNADNVPGTIAVEVLLGDSGSGKKLAAVSLGTVVLASSTVSPMPLKRAPVDDKATFQLPVGARGRSFDEITVRIKPERSRSLAGTQVAIKDFVLQR